MKQRDLKTKKRNEAEERQAKYDALPVEEKLKKAGNRERKRLLNK